MIQRIQTVLFLVAAICFSIACFMPVGTITTYESYYLITSWGLEENIPNGEFLHPTYFIGLLQIILAGVSYVAIFLYKKRPTQSRVCIAALILNCILLVVMLWVYPDNILPSRLPFIAGGETIYSKWTLLSMAPLACFYFANKFILKDEKKVRASDRLR